MRKALVGVLVAVLLAIVASATALAGHGGGELLGIGTDTTLGHGGGELL